MDDSSERLGDKTAIARHEAPLPYRASWEWIADNWETVDARQLAGLLVALSTSGWSYSRAYDCIEQMSEPSSALALQVIKHYLTAGPCGGLHYLGRKARLILPTLLEDRRLAG